MKIGRVICLSFLIVGMGNLFAQSPYESTTKVRKRYPGVYQGDWQRVNQKDECPLGLLEKFNASEANPSICFSDRDVILKCRIRVPVWNESNQMKIISSAVRVFPYLIQDLNERVEKLIISDPQVQTNLEKVTTLRIEAATSKPVGGLFEKVAKFEINPDGETLTLVRYAYLPLVGSSFVNEPKYYNKPSYDGWKLKIENVLKQDPFEMQSGFNPHEERWLPR